MQRARSSECNQADHPSDHILVSNHLIENRGSMYEPEIPRVMALLDTHIPQRPEHLLVCQL